MTAGETVLITLVLGLIILGCVLYEEARKVDLSSFSQTDDSVVERRTQDIAQQRRELEQLERELKELRANERQRRASPEFTLLRGSEDNYSATLLRGSEDDAETSLLRSVTDAKETDTKKPGLS